jgi:multiple sugar transport system substrate-binding protein
LKALSESAFKMQQGRRQFNFFAAQALLTGQGMSFVHAGQTPPPSARTLTVAAFPAVDAIARAAAPVWEKNHPGVKVEVISRQYADHHTAMTTALSTGVYLPDVMALEVGYLGRFGRGGLLDLRQAPLHADRFTSQFVPYTVQQATTSTGALVALPTDIGPGTLLYRKDCLDQAGVSSEDLSQTWESYLESGIKIKAKTGAYLLAHARNLKDLVIRAGIQEGEGLYFDQHNRVLVQSPRFTRAFELARQVRENHLDARVMDWSNEWSEGLRRGTLATQLSGAWLVAHMSQWLAPKTKGLWRACQLPESNWAAYGGSFLAIPKKIDPDQKMLATDFIQFLTLERQQQLNAFTQFDAFPALQSTFDDPYFDAPIPFLGGQAARKLWRQAAQHIRAVAVHRQDAFADEVINTELDKVLDQGKNIPTALADAAHLLERRAWR